VIADNEVPDIEETCTIAGYVKPEANYWKFNEPYPNNQGIKVEVLDTEFFSYTNSYGYFKISGLPKNTGKYTLRISKPGYLTRYVEITGLRENYNVSYPNTAIEIWAGDVTLDEVINMEDILDMSKAFNSAHNDERYKREYDLNSDNVINLEDFMIAAKHFNRKSDDYKKRNVIITPVPTPTPTPEVAYGEGKVEAEKMENIHGYVESEYEGEKCVELVADIGAVYYTFEGRKGYYDVKVRYLDEATGQGYLGLYVRGSRVGDAWKLDEDDNEWKIKTISDVYIQTGDRITVQGGKDGQETCKIDYVETIFKSAPTPVPTPNIVTISGTVSWNDIEGGFYKIGDAHIRKDDLFGVSLGSTVEVTGYYSYFPEMVTGFTVTSFKVIDEPDSIPDER